MAAAGAAGGPPAPVGGAWPLSPGPGWRSNASADSHLATRVSHDCTSSIALGDTRPGFQKLKPRLREVNLSKIAEPGAEIDARLSGAKPGARTPARLASLSPTPAPLSS